MIVSPVSKSKQSKSATAKAKGKRKKKGESNDKTGVAAARNDYSILSTMVSSPPPAVSRRHRGRVVDDEADEDETNEFHRNGYARDNFVVSDDDDDEESDAFEPLIPTNGAALKRNTSRRRLTAPITSDAIMNALSPNHRDVVHDFMAHAKQICAKIREDDGLQRVPFSDTILREMAIRLPRNQNELLQIPNINEEMVKRHARKFLPLIHNAKECLERDEETDDGDQTTIDPNHRNVIDLVSDDEPVDDDEYGSFPSELEDEEQFSSSYFNKNKAPDVKAWNERWSLSQQQPAAATNTNMYNNGAGSSKTNSGWSYKHESGDYGKGGGNRSGDRKSQPKKRNSGSNGNVSRNVKNKCGGGSLTKRFAPGGIAPMPT